MLRDEYLRRLVDAAYIDLFLAGNEGARIYWPWRMARENGSLGDRHRNACEVYWVDSSIGNEDYGNKEVLDDGFKYNAEAVLLADTMGEYDETVQAIHDGLDMADDHVFDGDIIIPLQAPYDKCYREFAGQSNYYAIGGLKDGDDRERVEAAKTVRELAGDDIHLHGLGWGVKKDSLLLRKIHENPSLIDSIDNSSAIQSNVSGMSGDEVSSVSGMIAGTNLIEDLRLLGSYAEVRDVQSELTVYE